MPHPVYRRPVWFAEADYAPGLPRPLRPTYKGCGPFQDPGLRTSHQPSGLTLSGFGAVSTYIERLTYWISSNDGAHWGVTFREWLQQYGDVLLSVTYRDDGTATLVLRADGSDEILVGPVTTHDLPRPPGTWRYRPWATAAVLLVSGLGAGLAGYHGYRRSRGSAASAFGWAVAGALFPFITVPVAAIQGYAEPSRRR